MLSARPIESFLSKIEAAPPETSKLPSTLDTKSGIWKDVNNDNTVDVLDIIFTINIILNNYTPNESEMWAADINHDDYINIQDIILIIQLIL